MNRILAAAASIAVSTLLLSATAASAEGTGYYSAVPAAQPTKMSFISHGTVWKFRDGSFVTSDRQTYRDVVVCQLVAQRAGKLNSFSVKGAALEAADLDKCNAVVK